jgi:hypothetical protein
VVTGGLEERRVDMSASAITRHSGLPMSCTQPPIRHCTVNYERPAVSAMGVQSLRPVVLTPSRALLVVESQDAAIKLR